MAINNAQIDLRGVLFSGNRADMHTEVSAVAVETQCLVSMIEYCTCKAITYLSTNLAFSSVANCSQPTPRTTQSFDIYIYDNNAATSGGTNLVCNTAQPTIFCNGKSGIFDERPPENTNCDAVGLEGTPGQGDCSI